MNFRLLRLLESSKVHWYVVYHDIPCLATYFKKIRDSPNFPLTTMPHHPLLKAGGEVGRITFVGLACLVF